jgi:hypothetical protein
MTDERPVEEGRDRLEQLEDDIAEVRRDLAEETGEDDEPRFIDEGDESEGETDNTIAPPG